MKSTSPSAEGEERAAGLVVFRDGVGGRAFLLLRHQQGGHWGFPKGRLEPGEEDRGAALREIREETGLTHIRVLPDFVSRSRYGVTRDGRRLRKTVTYFLGEVDSTSVQLSGEHNDARWLSAEAARQTLTHEESRRVLDEAEAHLASRTEGTLSGERANE